MADSERIALLRSDLVALLKELAKTDTVDFTGLGIVVFECLASTLHCDLRPGYERPDGLSLTSPKLVDFLLSAAQLSSPLHDGFVFFDRDGQLTHLAQYFVPCVVTGLLPTPGHGVRTHSALFGSVAPGVLLTGVICSNHDYFVFQQGKMINHALSVTAISRASSARPEYPTSINVREKDEAR